MGLFVLSLLRGGTASAAAPYAAQEMIRSSKKVEVTAGETVEFTIGFKNVGSQAWKRDGRNFVSVYTHDPKYRASVFAAPTWIKDVQPAKLKEAVVKPGQVGMVTFQLAAPTETGTYKETFHLAAEDLAWIGGGKFTVEIVVTPKRPVEVSNGMVFNYAPGYKATRLLVSDKSLSLEAGETAQFRVGFKNEGKQAWRKDGSAALTLKGMWDTPWQPFRHSSWSDNTVTVLPDAEVRPGQLALFTFTIAAPKNNPGRFTPRFVLMAGNDLVEGGVIEIPIEVRRGQVPSQVSPERDAAYARSGARGPNIRIGVQETRSNVVIAGDGPYTLVDGDHQTVRQLSGMTTVSFDFGSLTYTVRNGDFTYSSGKHVHFDPVDPAATILEIRSLENRPTWDPSLNFNKFRGRIEVFYARATGKLWVIEEVPLEDYMRGLAETSNGSPYEYQKALVTAARTYALFVTSIGGKHKSEYFDLDTTGNDQVYKGYVSETVRPNVVRAAEETRGQVVTYKGEVVVTPYFSRSDGRTRSWSEVWYGSREWLVSKPAPYDAGKTLWGHGVGMSASDAVGRAEAGASWTEILKYYYTGIELRQMY